MHVKVGCDPEVFVQNPNSGQFLCAHNMIPGDKANPFKVPFGAVQVDGMALEFNTDPADSKEEFLHNVKAVYHELGQMVPGYKLAPVPFANFDPEYFNNCPADAKVLGCDPDYNAWTGLKNNPPQANLPQRTASGHIHIGWTEGADPFEPGHYADCMAVVKQLDYSLGLNSLLFDKDNRRRAMYGQAGAFRPKSYGVEYRVLSNAWLLQDDLIEWVYETTTKSMDLLEEGVNFAAYHGTHAQMFINQSDNYPNGSWEPYVRQMTSRISAPPKLKVA